MFENQKCKQVIRQLKESIKDIDVTQKEEVENIMVDKKLSEDPDEQEISEQTTPSSKHSAIINTNEKKKAIEFGYSLDKRMSKCTPIYNDLHKACFALSQVIFRHIKFSRGMLFLEDLAKIVRNKEIQGSAIKRNNDINNKIEFTPSKNILKFNYCFNENLKFDLSVAQPKYLLNRVDTVDEIRKELTFEPRNDSIDQFASNNFIKFNLSDSEDEDPYNQKENKHQPFSFIAL